MRVNSLGLAAAMAVALPTAAHAATYMPTGPQQNVSLSTVTSGGWTLCFSDTMDNPFGSSASTTLAACTGDRIMLAGRETGSDTLLVLAQTLTASALADTGAADNGIYTQSDGSDWFYSDGYSWGFKTIGYNYQKGECGASNDTYPSMCLHVMDHVGGHSINGMTDWSANYEKLVFTSASSAPAVPEPTSWAMLIAGLGTLGGALRRTARARGALLAA
jgi:hypothetical protein